MTNETLEQAHQEIKRADHLLYVSLKYTRTVDVLRSIVERLINACDAGMSVLLEKAAKEKKIEKIPTIPKHRVDQLLITYPELKDYCELYTVFRKIAKANYDRSQEYRRHVTMTAHVDETPIEVTIDIISDYFEKTKEFISLVENGHTTKT